MREILFLAHRAPFPPDRGDRIRSFHLLAAAAELAPVHLVAFADDEADAQAAQKLGAICASVTVEVRRRSRIAAVTEALRSRCPISVTAFQSASLQARVDRLLGERPIDAIVAFSSQMAQFVPGARGERRFLMDFVDVDSQKFAAYAAASHGPKRWIYAREAYRLFRWERQVAALADVSTFVSEDETTLFRQLSHIRPCRVATVENGIDTDAYDPARVPALDRRDRGEGPLIVFTGQMDYGPNVEAMRAYVRDVLPIVRTSQPAARLAIVGRNPGRSVRSLRHQPGVIVTGTVPDVRRWIASADVVVAPLKIARGIQNKVLEAMALARPVVASGAAFEGIDAVPGRDLVVADDPRAAAQAVLAFINDRALADRIGEAARLRMIARYQWADRLAGLPGLLAGHREPVPA